MLVRADAAVVAPALALFGIGSLVGNGVSAWAVDRFGATRTATLALTAAAVAMAVLALGALPLASWAALAGWGMANFIATTALQTRLVGALPALVPAALPLNASATFAGQAFGAFMGGLWLAHGTHVSEAQHRPEAVGLTWIACLTLALAAMTASMLPSMVAGPEKS